MTVISIANASTTEGRAGTTGSMRFVVSLSAPAAQSVAADYATGDSAKAKSLATAGSDYTSSSGTLSFAIGQTEAYIDVPIIGDAIKESEESFDLVLSNVVGAALGKSTVTTLTATGTIIDDEPTISIADAKIDESAADTGGYLRFLVSLSAVAPQSITIDYATADGSKNAATTGADYTAASGTLTIPVGKLQGYIEVPILADTLVESDETLTLTLSNPTGGSFSKDTTISATGTITDDESGKGGAGAISASTTSAYEGDTLYFTVSLSAPCASAVSLHYEADSIKTKLKTGAAKPGSDFEKTTGTLVFNPGETSKQLAVNTNDDNLWEGTETFNLVLSSPHGAALTGNVKSLSITGTILDDEPTISATAASLYEPTVPTGGSLDTLADNLKLMRFAVTLSTPAANEVSVDYSTTQIKGTGAAKPGKDFAVTHGTLHFDPGEVTAYAYVEIVDDSLAEGSETFNLVLSKPVGGGFSGSAKTLTVVGTILDNEPSISGG